MCSGGCRAEQSQRADTGFRGLVKERGDRAVKESEVVDYWAGGGREEEAVVTKTVWGKPLEIYRHFGRDP